VVKQCLVVLVVAWSASAVVFASPDNPKHGYFSNGVWVELRPWYANGTLLQNGDIAVYLVEDGVRRCIPDPATFKAMSFDREKILHVTDSELNEVPEGEPFRSLAFGQ
jgi:hypothetical protein